MEGHRRRKLEAKSEEKKQYTGAIVFRRRASVRACFILPLSAHTLTDLSLLRGRLPDMMPKYTDIKPGNILTFSPNLPDRCVVPFWVSGYPTGGERGRIYVVNVEALKVTKTNVVGQRGRGHIRPESLVDTSGPKQSIISC